LAPNAANTPVPEEQADLVDEPQDVAAPSEEVEVAAVEPTEATRSSRALPRPTTPATSTRTSNGQRSTMMASLAAGRQAKGRITTWVNMRSKPDNKAAVVQVVPAGTEAVVLRCPLWCEVRAAGKQGWVFQEFLADPVGR
jgi:hypothetical protein